MSVPLNRRDRNHDRKERHGPILFLFVPRALGFTCRLFRFGPCVVRVCVCLHEAFPRLIISQLTEPNVPFIFHVKRCQRR